MSSSDQPDVNLSFLLANKRRRLEAPMYSKAAPAQQEILKKLSEAIEAERTRLRPAVRPKPEPRLGQPLGLDQVDSFDWDELLTRREESIFADLANQGHKASEVLDLVFRYCATSKSEIFFEKHRYFALKESFNQIAVKTVLEVVHGLRNNLNQKRIRPAIDKKVDEAEALMARVKELADPMVGKVSRQQAAERIGPMVGVNRAPQHIMRMFREHLYPEGEKSWPRPRSKSGDPASHSVLS